MYLLQRNLHIESHLVMLKALQPIFGHWVAELAQIAAHAETLSNMFQDGFYEPAGSDMPLLRLDLRPCPAAFDSVCTIGSDAQP